MTAVRRDIATGMPRPLLAERHQSFLLHWDGDRLAAGLRMLGDAGFPPFAGLPEDFGIEEIAVASTPDGVVRLAMARRIYGVRLSVAPGFPSSAVRLAWNGTDGGRHLESMPPAIPGDRHASYTTLWINDVVDGFRIEVEDQARLRGVRVIVLGPRT